MHDGNLLPRATDGGLALSSTDGHATWRQRGGRVWIRTVGLLREVEGGEAMTPGLMLLLVPLILIVAAVYASVGLGGGTGYLAVMALVGVPQGAIVHTALLLNIVVTGVAHLRFGRAGRMRWRLFLPFFLPAIPCAFLGGLLELDRRLFFGMLAVALFLAGIGMIRSAADAREREDLPNRTVFMTVAVPAGIGIGLLSGFLGMGGGILLGPLLLFLGWAGPKQVAAMNSALIFVLSAVALGAHAMKGDVAVVGILPLCAAAALGGLLGSTLADRRLSPRTLQLVFAVIVFVAGLRAGWDALTG